MTSRLPLAALALALGCSNPGLDTHPPQAPLAPLAIKAPAEEPSPVVEGRNETARLATEAAQTPEYSAQAHVDHVFQLIREGKFEVDGKLWHVILKELAKAKFHYKARPNELKKGTYIPKPQEWLFHPRMTREDVVEEYDPEATGPETSPWVSLGDFLRSIYADDGMAGNSFGDSLKPFYARMLEENPSDETLETYYTILSYLPENIKAEFLPFEKIKPLFDSALEKMEKPLKLRVEREDVENGSYGSGAIDESSPITYALERSSNGEWIPPLAQQNFIFVDDKSEALRLAPFEAFLMRRGPAFTEALKTVLMAFEDDPALTKEEFIAKYRSLSAQN